MIFRLSTQARNELADGLRRQIDAGGDAGWLKFYTGPMPEGADEPLNYQVLLAELRFSFPCAAEAIGGCLVFDPIEEDPAAKVSGTVEWALITDSQGYGVAVLDVSGPRGGGTIEINTKALTVGGPVRVDNFTVNIPAR